MKPIGNDATTALLRELSVNFAGFSPVFEDIKSRSWASATFVGARHELTFRLCGDEAEAAAERFAATLDVAEFQLRGHIVADISLVSKEACDGGVRLRLEALTVEDG